LPATGYRLKHGVSFCRVDGRTLFLDLRADRYFCLSPMGERAFSRLADGAAVDNDDHDALENLVRDGPLARAATQHAITACNPPDLPARSRLDETEAIGNLALLGPAVSLMAAPLRLRIQGMAGAVAWLARRKASSSGRATPQATGHVAAAFARLRLVATERNNCLTRSIAVADRLLAIGARPDLVIAVKLRPFYAHAWVQCDGWLINDRHEFVRAYTPILVV